ncbi:hypothetical protein F5B21DRAFT_500571 [Xylaria acuta]|nr:hypothetical protein F5B21DRAFT_500571 [Xylaria acuta]
MSALAKAFNPGGSPPTGSVEAPNQLSDLYVHGFERTVVFPCGHIFGDRCVREEYQEQRDLACPSCGFRMAYTDCGYAIAPAIISVSCAGSVRDTFPLTIPEEGESGRTTAEPPIEHDGHRRQHVNYGIKDMPSEIMMLVQPDFITRRTDGSAQKATEERDQRDVNTALLNTMVLTELEDTVWHRTATRQLAKEQMRRHSAGVGAVEYYLLGFAHALGEELPADVVAVPRQPSVRGSDKNT